MYTIALTGGIGSGKSTVAKRFQKLGITTLDADDYARKVVAPGEPALAQIIEHFGPTVVTDGELDRKKLREIVFKDATAKIWLEALLHPLILERMQQDARRSESPYVLLVIPLLVEARLTNSVDRILVIDCPEAQQLARAKKRDDVSLEAAQRIILQQAPRQARLDVADDVIDNSEDINQLDAQVQRFHEKYLALSDIKE